MPFTCEMLDAEFSNNAQVQQFLRGPDTSMTTKGVLSFEKLREARNYAAEWTRKKQVEASFVMEASEEDGVPFVTITKTKAWLSARQKMSLQYKAELKTLTDRFVDVSSPPKRARQEE